MYYNNSKPNPNPRPKPRRLSRRQISRSEWRRLVILLLAFFLTIFLFRLFGLALLIPLVPIILGLSLPKWYLSRPESVAKLVKSIAWSNVILWILPPLGLLVACATLQSAKHFELEKRKYLFLGYGGLIVTIVNIIWGLLAW